MAIVDFLLTGDPPIQTGITPGRLIPERAALVRGRVTDRDGAPLPGVRVSASDHPEWGQTFTQATGKYELVVNGGSYVRVRFEGTGLLPAERKPQVRWNQFEVLDDVVLLSLSQEATVVDLNSSEPQLAVGESMIDAAGTRRASVIFPAGTGATMTLPDGAVVDMTELTFRATEYTVGPEGKRAMPAELPATSAYTYAVELSADEALAAGASAVSFDQPVVVYVDNFLDFPVGIPVPTGYFDHGRGVWVPYQSGAIIGIVGLDALGAALVDLMVMGRRKVNRRFSTKASTRTSACCCRVLSESARAFGVSASATSARGTATGRTIPRPAAMVDLVVMKLLPNRNRKRNRSAPELQRVQS